VPSGAFLEVPLLAYEPACHPLPRDAPGVAAEKPDIDQLVPKVERAMRAYAVCKERLDGMQATLGQYLQPKDGTPAPSTSTTNVRRPGQDRAA
jgi:hypothetical protein